ncbi:alpha/beta hydrolase [Actinospica sp. MGRD01-02]|uniref:Alpha/beta hydrolase n=1 Tax=Actinospica acidithermotolerans TaxID=2828514 RepID=A0A941E6F3_9ACTN|nr:alpha/beta hydrolase [Actinospica acidithermotolerans]MBR7825302.1 alpha/beta hydrolase [Actinospica acidithermotolerans]
MDEFDKSDRTVWASDGRRLTVRVLGDRSGAPVFFMHGTPGSRIGPFPRSALLHQLGVRLIAYDRPGYGESDRLPLRSVAHAAADVRTIADDLGINNFSVVGRSGGGPHALACAALMPDRVSRCAVLVGLAPRHAKGLDWYEGMTESNRREYSVAESGVGALAQKIEASAEQIRNDPKALLRNLGPELPLPDWQVIADNTIRIGIRRNFAEALARSGAGWVDDARSFTQEWGFDPADILVPTLLWHGAQDVFSPVQHTHWLARTIPGSIEMIAADAAHFSAIDVLPSLLPWIAFGRRDPIADAA